MTTQLSILKIQRREKQKDDSKNSQYFFFSQGGFLKCEGV
ncbi:hypothetical protein SPBRAN_1031 [uncultured Candidatus Thioglobus sp.]|nr:hypothetical protein SPBRAN_1031 [uncultured Candidatus Thioglobus sp.]